MLYEQGKATVELRHGGGFDYRDRHSYRAKVSSPLERLFVSSLPADAEKFAHTVRGHWGIENTLHYALDVAYREEACRIRDGYSPQNMNLIRKTASTVARSDKGSKTNAEFKRWDGLMIIWRDCFLALTSSKITHILSLHSALALTPVLQSEPNGTTLIIMAIKIKRIRVLNDFAFKKVFGEKGDEVQLMALLNSILKLTGKDRIVTIEIVESKELPADFRGGKASKLDVRAVLADGTRVNIEIQLKNEYNMEKRCLRYWAQEYTKGIVEGQDYIYIPTVIVINILDFGYIPLDDFHTSFHLYEDRHKDYMLTDALEMHYIDIVKVFGKKVPGTLAGGKRSASAAGACSKLLSSVLALSHKPVDDIL
jgi:predicted transposase YbfD/YdcC